MKTLLILFTAILCPLLCLSQTLKTPTLSPFSKISQEIGLTEVNLEYSRPSAKGREVFGSLVPYDQVWRTGANASTKITLSEPAMLGGKAIQEGTYALYTIPGKNTWTIIIHANTELRSLAGDAYDPANDVLRFDVKPQQINHYAETFTIQFTELGSASCHLQLVWANTLVNIPIEVEVDKQIEQQVADFKKDPDNVPDRSYFEAAQYYLNNDKDLAEALVLINTALDKSPENFRYGLLKAKIQDKSGDRAAALATIDQAHLWAEAAQNANYMEQTELFKQSMLAEN